MNTSRSKGLTAADIMSQPVVTSRPGEEISRIASEMERRKIGSIVIVEKRKVVGILTERDFVRIVEQLGILLDKNLAKHHMTEPVVTVQSDAPVSEVVRLMIENHFRHIVVLNKNREVAGVISSRDLMKVASELMSV